MDDDRESRSNERLEDRALREGWAVSQDVKAKILKRLVRVIDPDIVRDEGEPAPDLDQVIRAARTVIAADQGQQKIDLVRQKEGSETVRIDSDVIAEAEQLAARRRLGRSTDRPPEPVP